MSAPGTLDSSLALLSLYCNRSSSPSNTTQAPPSYLDFVRTMNEVVSPISSPPPAYTPRDLPEFPSGMAELPCPDSERILSDQKTHLVELSCPYSERKLASIDLNQEAEEFYAEPWPCRSKPLQVIYAHIIPLPTICVTPPLSPASPCSISESGRSSSTLSEYQVSPSRDLYELSWQPLAQTPSLRHKQSPRVETLRQLRKRQSEVWLKEVYERQTRMFLERVI